MKDTQSSHKYIINASNGQHISIQFHYLSPDTNPKLQKNNNSSSTPNLRSDCNNEVSNKQDIDGKWVNSSKFYQNSKQELKQNLLSAYQKFHENLAKKSQKNSIKNKTKIRLFRNKKLQYHRRTIKSQSKYIQTLLAQQPKQKAPMVLKKNKKQSIHLVNDFARTKKKCTIILHSKSKSDDSRKTIKGVKREPNNLQPIFQQKQVIHLQTPRRKHHFDIKINKRGLSLCSQSSLAKRGKQLEQKRVKHDDRIGYHRIIHLSGKKYYTPSKQYSAPKPYRLYGSSKSPKILIKHQDQEYRYNLLSPPDIGVIANNTHSGSSRHLKIVDR